MKKRYYMYGHGGCNNHGCEAIVVSSVNMIGKEDNEFVLSSLEKAADDRFLEKGMVKEIYPDSYTKNKFLRKIYGAWRKFFKDEEIVARKTYPNFKKSIKKQPKETVFMSIGGDNYCCETPAWLYYSNRLIDKAGFKRVLWGCSVDAAFMNDAMVADLDGYALITAREEETFNALSAKLKKAKVVRVSDPAFTIQKEDSKFEVEPNTVGINFSPIVTQGGKNADVLKSVQNLIEYILNDTDKNILFIPHVNIDGNSDYACMKPLFDQYVHTGRVKIIGTDYKYAQLRDIISKCEMLICARTHSSISAYAMCVPTLVIGYSIKSVGIARDLFGTEQGYVISMKDMHGKDELTQAYRALDDKKEEVRAHLQEIMPAYVENAYTAAKALKELL